MSQVAERTDAALATRPKETVAQRNRKRVLFGGAFITLGAVVMASLPALGASGYAVTLAYYAAFYIALGQSWNLMSGMTGYLSVAHPAFIGIGGYTAVLLMNAGQGVAVALVAATAAAALAAFLVGLPSLRISGLAFAFTTLFFLEIGRLTITLWTPVTGGGAGVYARTILPLQTTHYLMVAGALAVSLLVLVVRHRQAGRELLAIRDDEQAAESIGIHTTKLKLVTFTASGAFAGYTGAVHGVFLAFLLPDSLFSFPLALIAIALPLIGGMGTVSGPIVGGLAYAYVREQFQVQAPTLHLVLLGTAVVLVVLFMPRGVVPTVSNWFARRRQGRSQ